jgi:hypothetical protein
MKKILKDIIQNQSEFTIDSPNFANEILVDEMINGSNFYVIKLSVCQFQNCDIVYGDFIKCRFKDCIFNKGLWRKSNFEDCVFQNCTFVVIKFSRAEFIDTCYDRPQKSTDKVTNETFLEATIRYLKTNFPKNNLEYKRNRSGELINVGHRTSDKYYRVYLKGECLRFEFEHKHRKTLNLYGIFLKTKQFRQLEQRISYEFLKQTQHLFGYSQETEKVEWLAQRLRPFQTRNSLAAPGTTINIHYIDQCPMKKLQKQDLIRFFQLLAYLKLLDGYTTANLRSKFRQYQFPVREFLYFVNPTIEVNQYQLGKAIDFFNSLENNLVLKFLADKYYRMLVTIPEAYATKVQNQWIAEVWVADEIFNYFEPFLFIDYFKQKQMTMDEFSVLFQIIQKFSVTNPRKDFDIPRFFDSYPSKLNGTRKKKIKDLFLRYIKNLQQEGKIQEQVLFPLQSESNSKRLINISDLNAERLVEPFVIFEVLQVNFVE